MLKCFAAAARVAFLLLVVTPTATAQWSVVNLHPAGATRSLATAVGGGQQVGWATVAGENRASLWSGSAGSWVDLTPTGATGSIAMGVSGGQQVGYAFVDGNEHASVWSGTSGSWVNLHPAGATSSAAHYADSNQQVGRIVIGDQSRASLWSGSAGSWVDLTPAGVNWAAGNGIGGGQQVGYAFVGSAANASLWTGSAASWVNLHPAGATSSIAWGVSSGEQVGEATVGSKRASLWRGTAASWVNLHPAGATSSEAGGVHNGQQVGYATMGGITRASLWSGTAASWVDLHAFLAPGFAYSWATGIWHDAGFTYVVGYGRNNATGRDEALMWVRADVATVQPDSFSIFRGVLFSGGLSDLLNSDENRLQVRPGITLGSSEAPIQVVVNGTSPVESPTQLAFRLEARASVTNIGQTIELFDFVAKAFVQLDTRPATTADSIAVVTAPNPSRFVQAGTRAVRAKMSWKQTGPVLSFPYTVGIDQTVWLISQ